MSFDKKLWDARQSLRMLGHLGTEKLVSEGPRTYAVHVPCKCGNCPKLEEYQDEKRFHGE